MKRRFSILIIFCLLLFIAKAQVLSLDSILSRIEKHNPALLSYTNKINSANELVNGARAWMPPMIDLQLGDNPYSLDFKTGNYQVMISAQQEIPGFRKLSAKENYLKSFAPIKQNEYEYLRNQFFAQAKEKYYERYITEKKIKVLNANIALMKSMIDVTEKQLKTGMSDLGSVYKMKARFADTQTMLIHEMNMIKSLTQELNYLMSTDITQPFELDTNNLVKNYRSIGLFALMDSLSVKRSDIQTMNSQINSMKLNKTLMSMQRKPDYGIKLGHTSVTMDMNMYTAMFSMTLPIAPWSSKGYKSEVKSMEFSIQSMEQDKQAMLNMAIQMVNMLIIEMNSEYTEVDNYVMNVLPAYKKSFDANLLAYSQNMGDLMKVILSWDDMQMAQMEYLKHLGVLLKTQADYEREMQIR